MKKKTPEMIPFNRPGLVGKELQYIREALEFGQLSGDGVFTKRCQQLLEKEAIAKRALLTHSCTAALEMAIILSNVGPGDEVILPSYTFVSTANAVCLRGATPVFVDIDPTYLCLDPQKVREAITERTKAVIMVHYAGVLFAIGEVVNICQEHNLVLIEDAAQALGATLGDKQAGSFGDLSAFSFHETKNVISGEGGFLGINNTDLMERAEIIREKGTNRSKFFRGEVDKYTWVDVGSSFLPGELIAAFLYAQLEKMHEVTENRLKIWGFYDEWFQEIAHKFDIKLPKSPNGCRHNGHMYYLIFPDGQSRSEFISYMKKSGIITPFHYVPLHSSPAGKLLGRTSSDMAVTDSVSERLVRLPLYQMNDGEHFRVLENLQKFFQ